MRQKTLIVALDRPSAAAGKIILDKMPDSAAWFKVGLELFTADGPAALAMLKRRNKNIFLDLKLHDIPNTVAGAVRSAAAHEVALLTLHALGGPAMIKAASEAARAAGPKAPKLIAVTILTSHGQEELEAIGIGRKISDEALALAGMALESGADGLVASFSEARLLREKFGNDFILVVPGIRPAGAAKGDQKRVATPAMAVAAGADFLVVGRPIIDAPDPGAAAAAILNEIGG